MKLKNNALQELYDTLTSGTISFSPYAESPVDKAYRECDDKLQKDIDFWKCGNEIIHSVNVDLVNYKQKLEKEIEGLKEHILENHKIIAGISSERDALEKERDNLLSRTHCAEDEVEELKKEVKRLNEELSAEMKAKRDWPNMLVEKGKTIASLEERLMETKETLEKANADRTELQKDRDSYHELYTELSKTYDKLSEDNKQIKKVLHTAEEARNNIRAELEAKVKRMDEITSDRDFFFKQYHALKDDYEKLNARTDCLRKEVKWYRKHYRDQSDKIENLNKKLEYLTSQYQKLTIENKRVQDNVRKNCYDQGQTDLWVKLQDVRDVNLLEEFDPECETLGDIIDMDLEDFLDAYKNWQEEKEKNRFDHMRDYLDRFCEGRVCEACPLGSTKYKCGCGYSFKKATVWDSKIIPDEELERYYEKARGCGKLFIHDLRNPINAWECTIEATVEVNKDLLEKVCGIKLGEEEHKLEYGDAVRLPWLDYDYMYIGPDEEEETIVRMFDPKNHAIATSHIGNVRYSGCKIILTSEEDLRKIWKDKK